MRTVLKDEALAILAREAEAMPPRFEGCVMCALVAGHPPDLEVVGENRGAVAVLDRFATRRGHVLVVLRRHVESIADLGWEEYALAQRLAWEASRAIGAALHPQRIFIAALGAVARLPMSFPHHHVHVIPLYDGDERDRPAEVFSWSRGVGLYEPGEAPALAADLRRAWTVVETCEG
jgi:diadenosine tetraphosphate (Ap4A) HIT family hydrolase